MCARKIKCLDHIGITPEEATNNLIHSIKLDIGNRKFFSAQDSMETLNLDESILNVNIKSLNGIPDLLYSEDIYNDEKEIGIEMPIDRLVQITNKTIVLIGVSGCGKTRTCYDMCRKYWGLYFDCFADVDFNSMIKCLESIRPRIKTEETQKFFEGESKRLVECLISSRLLVLQTLRERYPELKFFEWLCIQRSRSRNLFSDIFTKVSQLPWSVSLKIYYHLKKTFQEGLGLGLGCGRVIFDEAQHMLELLNLDYQSTNSRITKGHFAFPRSFFSFLTKFIFKDGFRSIWCGTHMRIRSMELLYSAAGGKEAEICIFTEFNYLKPSHIFKLLGKWLSVTIDESNVRLFEEISQIFQGRPRFFISFLHNLIKSNDIDDCFRMYVRNMTTNYDSALSDSSPYFFWKQRIGWIIQPIEKNTHDFETRVVSTTLVKLCISYLFGDGLSIAYSPDLDLVSTSLVMVSKKSDKWHATMAEPIVLCAGLNYLADQEPQTLMDYFANQLFLPHSPLNLTPQERGHMMECVIALRFLQGWWLESNLQSYLPQWAIDLNIQKPLGVIDCRSKESDVNMFVQQLLNANFPWLIFPSVNAGPDLRYSIFCCYVKTTSTPNSHSTVYVDVHECKKNIGTMNPRHWYKSQLSVQEVCLPEIQNKKFIHVRFELPDTAPSMKDDFRSGTKDNDYIICVNLGSPFAKDFFGDPFVQKYREFVSQLLNK